MDKLYPYDNDAGAAITRVKVVGVGGGGVNTVERLMSSGSLGVEIAGSASFAAVNTDVQALAGCPVAEKLVIGRSLTRGLGAGGEAELGRRAAEADRDALDALVAGYDLVILIVALGGGTGSGAAPVVAEAARKAGAMVVAFATLPFSWEGERRTKQALAALENLREHAEAVVPLRNDMLLQGDGADADVESAFDRANAWICSGLNALGSMLFRKGLINIDFATLRSALPVSGGRTLFGVGVASGENRFHDVISQLLECPLLHTQDSVRVADTLVVNIVGGPGLSLSRVNTILEAVKDKFGGRENTVLGALIDESRPDTLEVCVLGSSGIKRKMNQAPVRRPEEVVSARNVEDPEALHGETDLLDTVDPSDTPSPEPARIQDRPVLVGDMPRPEQTELEFEDAGDFFHTGDRTIIDGQDIDSPTFQRRHIRIRL